MGLSDRNIETVLEKIPAILPDLSAGTLDQIARWGRPLLQWCAAENVRPTSSDPTLLGRYERAYPDRFGRSRAVVLSQLRKVLRVADAALPKPRGSGGTYAARVRALPDRGRLPHAVRTVMASARDGKHRGQLETTVGRFLLWCDGRAVRPEACLEADLTAYRRALQHAGMTSTGAEVDGAKRLLRALGVISSART